MKKKILIGSLAFIGFLTTIKLAIIYFNANFNPYALSSFCSVNQFIDCDGIAQTTKSQFLGVPLAYWGMFFYLFVLVMLLADKLKNFKLLRFLEVFKNPLDYIASLGIISFIISMTLLFVSLFEINKLCILCAFTYILNLSIGLIALDFSEKNGLFKPIFKSIRQSFIDFIDAVKIKKYLIALIIVVLFAGAGLAYTTITMKFAPQVVRERKSELKEFVHAKKNKYAITGNILGDENAQVTIYVFSDYQCPICFAHNIIMHKLAKEMKNVKIVHKNMPLDMECNTYMKVSMHEGACVDAKFAIAAEKQGKFWEMNDILFEKKPKSEPEILKLVNNKGFDMEKLVQDANSIETYQQLSKEIDEARNNGIEGTPATIINGKVDVGIKTFKEYVEKIEQLGAEKR